MSDVGGAVGLWIGLSILSICELFQLLVELCDYAVNKTVKERRVDRKRRRKQAANNGINNSIRLYIYIHIREYVCNVVL